jgi:hypothetical protein
VAAVLFLLSHGPAAHADAEFDQWRGRLWIDAQQRGIRQAIFDRATTSSST